MEIHIYIPVIYIELKHIDYLISSAQKNLPKFYATSSTKIFLSKFLLKMMAVVKTKIVLVHHLNKRNIITGK